MQWSWVAWLGPTTKLPDQQLNLRPPNTRLSRRRGVPSRALWLSVNVAARGLQVIFVERDNGAIPVERRSSDLRPRPGRSTARLLARNARTVPKVFWRRLEAAPKSANELARCIVTRALTLRPIS